MAQDDTLTARQRRVLSALLSEPTVKGAAEVAGVGRKTVYRYLADPAFHKALREAQGERLKMAVARMTGLLEKALDAIGLDLGPGHDKAQVRLRAAGLVLRHYPGLLEVHDLEDRVASLERAMQEQRTKGVSSGPNGSGSREGA